MLRSPVGLGRLTALTLALLVAVGPATTATQRPAPRPGPATSSASADDRIGDLALSLEYDLKRIFRFVADEVRYEPYVGILRGPVGTLDAGAGNSLDQALLLAALLDASGIPHRFVRGGLDEAAAERLAESSVLDAAGAKAAIEVALAGGPHPAPVEIPTPEPADPQVLADARAAAATALVTSRQQVTDTVTVITNTLSDSGIELGGLATASRPADLLPGSEVTSHTWLQAAFGADWLDLDPTLGPGAAVGETLAPATETLDALPDELRHRVRFEVLLEQVRGEALQASPVIEYEAYADELNGRTITLAHTKPSELEGLGIAIGNILGDAKLSYHPVLLVPGRSIVGEEVAFGAGGGGGVFGDDFLGASPGPTGLADGEASAEWLAVTVTSPGSEPVVARRPVFDRVPPGIRYGGEPTAADVQPADLVRFTPDGDLEYAPLLGLDTFAISTGPSSLDALLVRAADPSADMLAILAGSYAGLRDIVAAEQAGDDGTATFVDRPGVVSLSMDVVMVGDQPTLRSGLDIWHRSLAAMPTSDGSTTPATARIVAGVAEYVAERQALESGPSDGGQATSVGVGRVFEAAAGAGVPIRALRGSLPDAMSFDPRSRALIQEALEAGDAVIVPAHEVDVNGQQRLGWWRVDPVTGRTSDMMDDGTGSETVEYSLSLRVALCVTAFAPLGFSILWGLAQDRVGNIFNATGAGITTTWYAYLSEAGWKPLLGCATGRGPAV
jgi:hypothetical protein